MQKTKKVKRQNKGGQCKKKRIFTMKTNGGYPGENVGKRISNFFRGNNQATVAPAPPNPNDKLPYSLPTSSLPTPIRSRPPSSVNEEGSMFRDVDDTTSATTDSHDTRYNIGNLYPLNEKVQDQHISPGSALTLSPTSRPQLTDDRTLRQLNMIQQNKQRDQPQQTSIQSNTTSSTGPPNNKCLSYVSAWLQNRDWNNKIQIKNQPTMNEYNNFVNDMINKGRLTQEEIDACLQYSNIESHKTSVIDSTTSTSGSNSTEYSNVVTDSTSANSTSTDKTYIVKYKLINGTPQEKEVFVQDPIKKIYSRHLFDNQGGPKSCYFTVPYDQLGTHLNGSIKTTECNIPLTPMGSIR